MKCLIFTHTQRKKKNEKMKKKKKKKKRMFEIRKERTKGRNGGKKEQ